MRGSSHGMFQITSVQKVTSDNLCARRIEARWCDVKTVESNNGVPSMCKQLHDMAADEAVCS